MRRLALVLFPLLVCVTAEARSAAELQLALRKLAVTGNALYVAAHPDDENTAMLAYLANEKLLRTGYLSVTRGDGGQNLIGNETGPLLGVIRTEELLAAREIDRADQFFTRAIDFGYTKTPEETMSFWGREAALSDVVWVIRKFQPDVVIMRFPVTGEGGHGQHTASAILAEEAFRVAGDATKFPEQLQHVSPWQPRRIFWNRFSWRPVDPNDPALAKSIRVDLGRYNPLLGRAYTEIAAESRTQHKSQGFGSAERRGTLINYFDQRGGDEAKVDLFEGIDTSWSRYAGGETVGSLLSKAAAEFRPDNPAASVPTLLEALRALDRLRALPEWSESKRPWVSAKRRDLLEAIRDCAGIAIDVSAASFAATPGSELPVSVSVVNRSDYPFRLAMVASIHASPSKAPGTKLENNVAVKTELILKLPADLGWSQPYWLTRTPGRGMYDVQDQHLIGTPVNPPSIPINITLEDPSMNTLIFTVPAQFRRTDPVLGEQIRDVEIVPRATLRFDSDTAIFADARPRDLWLTVRAAAAAKGQVSLKLPTGWKAAPESVAISLAQRGEEQRVRFTITPPAAAAPSADSARAELRLEDGTVISKGLVEISYPHIPARTVLTDAATKLVRADIKRVGTRVGYIMGSGDEVPSILRQVGYDVLLISDAELERGDFSAFDRIVTGVRAYNTRKALRSAHPKLMSWVENGGTLVVQYNTLEDLAVTTPGPLPFKISRDRVSVEEAPIRFVDPNHPLLTTPNRITSVDFDGWVQERGLYFTAEPDPRYAMILGSNDPGETEKLGGQLFARHGKGVFIYSSYSWWRQLAAGVPGAIRAFVNLVSAE